MSCHHVGKQSRETYWSAKVRYNFNCVINGNNNEGTPLGTNVLNSQIHPINPIIVTAIKINGQ